MTLAQARAVELLHLAPGAVVVAEGLVDEVQVDVAEPEPLQRRLERAAGLALAVVLDPQLGGHEQLVAGMPLAAMARPTASSFW
jgi:hypothetical protein